jgi:hypothetical protein
VARAAAREGAKLYLTGRLRAPVDAVAQDIGSAEAAEVSSSRGTSRARPTRDGS